VRWLLGAELRQGHVGVAPVDVDDLGTGSHGALAGDVAVALTMTDQEQFHRSTGGDMPYRWGS